MLSTSGFGDDVMFGGNRPESKTTRAFRSVRQVEADVRRCCLKLKLLFNNEIIIEIIVNLNLNGNGDYVTSPRSHCQY